MCLDHPKMALGAMPESRPAAWAHFGCTTCTKIDNNHIFPILLL